MALSGQHQRDDDKQTNTSQEEADPGEPAARWRCLAKARNDQRQHKGDDDNIQDEMNRFHGSSPFYLGPTGGQLVRLTATPGIEPADQGRELSSGLAVLCRSV